MVTIVPSSNVLLPLPSFIGRISTSLQSRSKVTIGWWPRRGVNKLILEGTGLIVRNYSRLPVWRPRVHSCSGNAFIIVDHKGVLARASWSGTPLAAWSEGLDNK
ncbi:hypothetical protein O181_111776 [Austropuccinia psidii MF-1]|uniref:Uncharacterized protein n=1 Tax=Austropuccinia psidii MF-1 TaxID=1389203 RepID=A0A9Q3PSZ2_9BASI|nr:hypothetical protein [Austropuccinia psidii MF-1]